MKHKSKIAANAVEHFESKVANKVYSILEWVICASAWGFMLALIVLLFAVNQGMSGFMLRLQDASANVLIVSMCGMIGGTVIAVSMQIIGFISAVWVFEHRATDKFYALLGAWIKIFAWALGISLLIMFVLGVVTVKTESSGLLLIRDIAVWSAAASFKAVLAAIAVAVMVRFVGKVSDDIKECRADKAAAK